MTIPAAGITPAASFELAGFEPPQGPPTILADMIDPETGEFASLTRGRSVADGIVQHLVTVQRGSGAAVRRFGQRFREITHNDATSRETLESLVAEALKPAVDSGTIRFERIVTEADPEDPTQAQLTVEYIDLLSTNKDANRRKTFSP